MKKNRKDVTKSELELMELENSLPPKCVDTCRSVSYKSDCVWYIMERYGSGFVVVSEHDMPRYERLGYKVRMCFYHERHYRNCFKNGEKYQFVS